MKIIGITVDAVSAAAETVRREPRWTEAARRLLAGSALESLAEEVAVQATVGRLATNRDQRQIAERAAEAAVQHTLAVLLVIEGEGALDALAPPPAEAP